MVVDDDQTVHIVLKFILEKLGFQVFAALDSVQGLMMARQIIPDLIVLDIGLPAGGGFTVFSRIKQMRDTFQIPILIYSATVAKEEIEKKIPEAGNILVLAKPSPPDQIMAAVTKLCAGSR